MITAANLPKIALDICTGVLSGRQSKLWSGIPPRVVQRVSPGISSGSSSDISVRVASKNFKEFIDIPLKIYSRALSEIL